MKLHINLWGKEQSSRHLLITCYAAGLVVLFLLHVGLFAANRLAYWNGSLQQQELTYQDFTLDEIMEKDGLLVTTGADPKMIWNETGRRVETVLINFEYSLPPLVQTAFWANEGEGHSVRRMAYPRTDALNGTWFLLPAQGGKNLRIDPGVVAGNTIKIHSITINKPRAFLDFFIITSGEWAILFILPGLTACGLKLLNVMWQGGRKKGAANE